VIPKPTPLAAAADDIDKRIWEKEIDECTEYLKAKLEALTGFPSTKENFNVFKLIKAVKGVTFRLEDNR
jgi:hypothetical protein